MTFGQLALIGSGGYTPEDVHDVMAIMESGKWDIEKLITHEYPWDELEEAIQMAGRPDHALNVVVKY
jgi:threonine dehydrogenase-like Zn-dependent dehydrogenase